MTCGMDDYKRREVAATASSFRINVWVVLPEHLHCVIELSAGGMDFAFRWR